MAKWRKSAALYYNLGDINKDLVYFHYKALLFLFMSKLRSTKTRGVHQDHDPMGSWEQTWVKVVFVVMQT